MIICSKLNVPSILCVQCLPRNVDAKCMSSCKMDRHVRVPEVGERWWVLVPEYSDKGKLNVAWCGPYKVLEVLNKGENVKQDIPAPFDGL